MKNSKQIFKGLLIGLLNLLAFYSCQNQENKSRIDEPNKKMKKNSVLIDSTIQLEDKNEFLLINEKFYSSLINGSENGDIKIKKAIETLKIGEPIMFSVFRGGVSRKK